MDDETLFSVLANPHRRLILQWLADPRTHFPPPLPEHAKLPGACATYITQKSALSQATASTYLGQLERAGLITRSRHGKWTFFARNEAAIAAAKARIAAVLEGQV